MKGGISVCDSSKTNERGSNDQHKGAKEVKAVMTSEQRLTYPHKRIYNMTPRDHMSAAVFVSRLLTASGDT